jgi:Kef-type K+ transport system membrane component KefB
VAKGSQLIIVTMVIGSCLMFMAAMENELQKLKKKASAIGCGMWSSIFVFIVLGCVL